MAIWESGNNTDQINPEWRLILYAVQQINQCADACGVKKKTFRMLCYVLTREGIKTGFEFHNGKYGLYSYDVNQAEQIMVNANLLIEKSLGKHGIDIITAPDFVLSKCEYSEVTLIKIEKAINLFCSFKNAEQAEMAAAVIFTFDKSLEKWEIHDEMSLFNYALRGRSQWTTEENEKQLSETIRLLVRSDWLHSRRSPSLSFIGSGNGSIGED